MTEPDYLLNRRQLLRAAAGAGVATFLPAPAALANESHTVNDITQLNPVEVAKLLIPTAEADIRLAIQQWRGTISVGGGRFSMGGQIAQPDSLHLDMRNFRQVLQFDPEQKRIRVQAGITWRDIQEVIDPHDLSVRIMQSYSNFTVGGSVSVNCHGRYVGSGPLINSVHAFRLMAADGSSLEVSRTEHPELFRATFGGYAGLGVITEVELDLADNCRMERAVSRVSLSEYPDYFRKSVLHNPKAILHNADLRPPDFSQPHTVTWLQTEKPATEAQRLVPKDQDYDIEQNVIWAMTELPGGEYLRRKVIDPLTINQPMVVWRNFEASLDTASLEPRTRLVSTYLLQEYFIPVANFHAFATAMAKILQAHDVNALNVSIRHSPADTLSTLSWAPVDVFSFVLYYKRRRYPGANTAVERWTRKLIDAALASQGRYYLPYRLDASLAQFQQAYPEARAFADIKKLIDPDHRFRNRLWDKYLATTMPPAS